MPEITLDREDIQGILLHGYKHHPYAAFLFLTIDEVTAARAWLRTLVKQIHTAVDQSAAEQQVPHIHIAFSKAGLHALNLDDNTLATFAQEFTQGMADADRARSLGDIGPAGPEHWEFGGTAGDAAADKLHILLLLYAQTDTGPLVEQHLQA